MKKVLVVFPSSMQLGGIERSLLGLLDSLAADPSIETDAFIYGHHGELFGYINKNVFIYPEIRELAYLRESFLTKIGKGAFLSAFMRILQLPGKNDFYRLERKVREKTVGMIGKEYDLAIGFFMPFDFLKYNVRAKRTIGWIHTDYMSAGYDREILEKQYALVDTVAAVSEGVRESFCRIFPEYAYKTVTVENILPLRLILDKSDERAEGMEKNGDTVLLSVGRFCKAKNFDNVPAICGEILRNGLNVRWYLIGYGSGEKQLRKVIRDHSLTDRVIILGKKENPYPYIKKCDLYVQPSRFEGKSVSVREAQALGKPVVITAFPTSPSQLKDGYDGIIVPLGNKECADGISALLCDPEKMKMLSRNCLFCDYSNRNEIEKLWALL